MRSASTPVVIVQNTADFVRPKTKELSAKFSSTMPVMTTPQVTTPGETTVDVRPRSKPKPKEFLAKVTLGQQPNGEEKVRLLGASNETELSIARGIFYGGERGRKQVVNAAWKNDDYRTLLINKVLKDINQECADLCSSGNPSGFGTSSVENLVSFDVEDLIVNFKERASLLFKVLETVIGKKHDPFFASASVSPVFTTDNKYAVVTSSAVLLHQRNIHLSRILFMISLLADFGGATDATIKKMQHLGITLSASAILSKKKEIEVFHDAKISEKIDDRRQLVETTTILQFHLQTVKLFSLKKVESVEYVSWVIDNVFPSQDINSCAIKYLKSLLSPGWDMYGDNLDHTVKTHHMSKLHRGQDIHWFLLLGAEQRVTPPDDLSTCRPRRSILTVQNDEFLPSLTDNISLRESFVFHVMEVLVQRIPWLQQFKKAIPPFIDHPFVDQMSAKSTYEIIDLLEKNENKSDEVIEIVQRVHEFIPSNGVSVYERLVFGGDQLTNERAYQAQLEMINGTNEADRLHGLIHRTEGLHMCMNICKLIMDYFFSKSSVRDEGTLYNLKILLDRRDIKLDMTTGYNSCKHFIDDVLDAHIIAAALQYYNVNSVEDTPSLPPLLDMCAPETQCAYVKDVASAIVDSILCSSNDESTDGCLEDHFVKTEGNFTCNFCKKTYQSLGWMKNHLKTKHSADIEIVSPIASTSSQIDGKLNYAIAFMKIGLLFRDTRDLFKMGDGDRLFRNLKFLMLNFDIGKHIKYKLWSWRLLAYDMALLSERERFIYRNNIAVNMTGRQRECIANDNLVEIHVKKVKECMRAMGANLTFKAARTAAKCISVVSGFMSDFGKRSGRHTSAKTDEDVRAVVTCLFQNQILVFTPGRAHDTYPNMASDLLLNIDWVKMDRWLTIQKKRASLEM